MKLYAALEHSITPTYQKGEMAIRAHEKIGMGEVKYILCCSEIKLY
jgi:hypothetical protein